MTRTEAADTVRVMERFGLNASAKALRERYRLKKPSDKNKPKAPANK